MTDGAPEMAPGLTIRPWRHFFGTFRLADRLLVHRSLRVVSHGVVLAGHGDTARPEEVALLDGAVHPDRPAIDVFTTPRSLRARFAALDADALPGGVGAGIDSPSAEWTGFSTEVASFFAHVRAPLGAPFRLMLEARDPSAALPLWSSGSCREVMDAASAPRAGAADGPAAAAHVNLGDEPLALLLWNQPVPAMASLLAHAGESAPEKASDVALRFVERFPACPVPRLTLLPGDGVFVPVGLVAHEMNPFEADELAVLLTAIPGAGRT